MSKLITNTVRHVDGTADNITLDSSQNVTVEGNLFLPDNKKLNVGTSNDLQIKHDGNDSIIKHDGGGTLYISTGSSAEPLYLSGGNDVYIRTAHNESAISCIGSGSVELYYDNAKKLETSSVGTLMPDGAQFELGTSRDFKLYHSSDNSYIHNETGSLYIKANGAGDNAIIIVPDGAVELYYDNSKHLATSATGGALDGVWDINNGLKFYDSIKAKFGTGDDLQIYHNGTDNMLYAALANNFAIVVHNDGNDLNRWGMRIQAGANDASGTNFALTVSDGNGTHQGYITFTGGTVTYGAFTAHHPCIVPDSDNPSDNANAYPYGTLLETISIEYTQKNGADTERGIRYKVQKTQSANSKKVLGAYGSSMNGGPDNQTNEHQALILGDGHILVNNAGGNIEIGDGICSSATAGIGQKATANPSMIIGIAQEAITFTGSETKLVAVQYGLQQFTPWT